MGFGCLGVVAAATKELGFGEALLLGFTKRRLLPAQIYMLCTYIYIYIHIQMYIYIRVYTYIYIYANISCVYIYIHICRTGTVALWKL